MHTLYPQSLLLFIVQRLNSREQAFPPMAASILSLPNHSLPLALSPQTLKPQSPKTLSIIPKSTQSQFHGLKLSHQFSLSSPSPFASLNSGSRPAIFAAKITEGNIPPDFKLKDQDGKVVSLSQFKGKPAVVYFYPADDSPGCTKEACAFRDSYEKFKKAGAEVIGISGDDVASHKAFKEKYRLPFALLSDEGNKVRKEWGVPTDLFGALPGRQTYVLDKNGVVRLIYNNQFQAEKHIEETLKFLQTQNL